MIMICLFFTGGWGSGKRERRIQERVKKEFLFQENIKIIFPIFSPPTIRIKIVCMFLACFHASSTENKNNKNV